MVYALGELEEVMRFSFIIIGMLTQLMIICYSGQKLIDESQNIFTERKNNFNFNYLCICEIYNYTLEIIYFHTFISIYYVNF